MSTFTKPALSDGARAVLFSLAFGAVLVFVPLENLLSLLVAPLVPIPVALVTARHGKGLGAAAAMTIVFLAGVLALVAAGMGHVMFGIGAGLILSLLVLPIGLGSGIILRRGPSQFRLFLFVAAACCLSLSVWLVAMILASGSGPVAILEAIVEHIFESSRTMYTALGMSQQDIDTAKSDALEMASVIPYLAPALLLVSSAAFSGVWIWLARRFFDRMRQPFPKDFMLRELRFHFAFAYVMIFGLLCQLAAPYLPEAYESPVSLAGANLLIVAEVVFFIQGIAVANFFLCRYRVSKLKRAGVYIGLVLLQGALSLTSWLGLFDTWIDYRRRFTKQRA